MKNLPAVSLKRFGTEHEVSFPASVVEDCMPGRAGSVRLLGGPALHGHVREAMAVPLRSFPVGPPPSDRTPEQLQKRREIGEELMRIAAETPPEDSDLGL